jgi:pantothenate kinase
MSLIYSVEELAEHVEKARARKPGAARLLVAIAGAPGSGKSTLAELLRERLNRESVSEPGPSVIVPMDGFHLDNAILQALGQMAVKGAPQTFDVEGFHSLLMRLAEPSSHRAGMAAEVAPLFVPVFDRAADLARNAAQAVESHHRIIIVEGNYLLLSHAPWRELTPVFDLSVMLDVPLETLTQRLVQRWLDHGHTPQQARQRAESNDLPNAVLVVQESIRADLHYKSVRQ